MNDFEQLIKNKIEKDNMTSGNKRKKLHEVKEALRNIKINFYKQIITEKFKLSEVLEKQQFEKDENSELVKTKISHVVEIYTPNNVYMEILNPKVGRSHSYIPRCKNYFN